VTSASGGSAASGLHQPSASHFSSLSDSVPSACSAASFSADGLSSRSFTGFFAASTEAGRSPRSTTGRPGKVVRA
jgi:hypothetical protein